MINTKYQITENTINYLYVDMYNQNDILLDKYNSEELTFLIANTHHLNKIWQQTKTHIKLLEKLKYELRDKKLQLLLDKKNENN